MKVIRLSLVLLCVRVAVLAQTGESPIQSKVLTTTVMIKAHSITDSFQGTGFIIQEPISAVDSSRVIFFLATNKHMIGAWSYGSPTFTTFFQYLDVTLYSNSTGSDLPTPITKRVDLSDANGQLLPDRVIFHSDSLVDVALVNISSVFNADASLRRDSFHHSYFCCFDSIQAYHFNIGDQVFVLGYPLGITSVTNSFPVAKSGYLSSVPGDQLSIDFPAVRRNGSKTVAHIVGKVFLVDGLIVPGNSGGPVILPSVIKSRYNPKSHVYERLSGPTANLVIGILSADLGGSGLSVVWSTDYVTALVREYFDKHGFSLQPYH